MDTNPTLKKMEDDILAAALSDAPPSLIEKKIQAYNKVLEEQETENDESHNNDQ